MADVIAPGQRDDAHIISLAAQVLHQLTIIEIAAGDRLQSSINQWTYTQLSLLPIGGPGI